MDSTLPNFTDDPSTAHDESKTFAEEKNVSNFATTLEGAGFEGMGTPPDASDNEKAEELPYVARDLDKNEREAVKQKEYADQHQSAEGIGKGCSIGGKVPRLGE